MPDDIYTGVNCCEDAEQKGWDIHATPRIVWATPGQRITLQATRVTRECDPGCIYWRILSGGGTLAEEFGIAVTYLPAEENKDCAGSALIGLFCGGALRDTVHVAINQYEPEDTAYWKAGAWHDGYYPGEVLAGTRVTDPETYITKVVYEDTEAVIKYIPDKDYYGDTKPKVSTIFLTEHTCSGKTLNRNYVAIRNVATEGPGGKRILLAGKWHAINPSALLITALSKGNYDFATAKQMSLDGFMDARVTVKIPTQYSIPPRLPAFQGVEEMEKYNEERRLWELWRDYASRVRRITLKEQATADLRNPAMLAGGCCSPYLI